MSQTTVQKAPTSSEDNSKLLAAAAAAAATKLPQDLELYRMQVERAAASRETLVAQAVAQVSALLRTFDGWYSDTRVAAMVKKMLQTLQGAQRAAASTENAYLTYVLSTQTGQPVRPAPLIKVDHLRGPELSMGEVYERLAREYRYQRSLGKSTEDTLDIVLDRAEVMVDTDITLAVREQDREVLTRSTATVGYRRVVHPEMSKGGTCGMCIAASDRTYYKKDLLPIHARCHCTVAPILDDGTDPGNSLNNLSLGDLYSDAGGTSMKDLKRTRYQIDEHGELGPVLVPARRKKTSGKKTGKRPTRATPNSRQGTSK